MEGDTIKVVLADDHPIVRNGIKSLINRSSLIEVIAEASSGEEALELVESKKPDVLVTDISMSALNGIELAQIISNGNERTKVLILSVHQEHEYILKAYEAGALGYLPKNCDESELVQAISTVYSGKKYLNQHISEVLAQSLISEQTVSKKDYNLTKRENEILKMLVEGMSNKQIAAEIFVSVRTVDTHRTNIMKKLQVNNVAEMVRIGVNEDLCA